MRSLRIEGRIIYAGEAEGLVLWCSEPISFYGGVDLSKGVISESGHPLQGRSIAGTILVFPTGKGSTVGSYALLRLAREGRAPSALVMGRCDTTVAVGAIIGEIPCVDLIDIEHVESEQRLAVRGGTIWSR